MNVELYSEISGRFLEDWWALGDQVGSGFAARPSYGLNWYRQLGKGELAVAAVYEGDTLMAVLPMHVRDRLGAKVYRLLGHGLGTIGSVPARTDEALDELVKGLYERGVVLQLTHLRADDPFRKAVRRHGGWDVDFFVDDYCPIVALPPGRTASDLRSKSSIKRALRTRRTLRRDGLPIDFEIVDSVESFDARWKDIADTASEAQASEFNPRLNLCAAPYSDFTREFLREEAERGNLLIWGAKFDGVWSAHFVTVRTDDVAQAWITRYSPDVGKHRPGHQLLQEICDTHDDFGIVELDLLIGRNRYKADWQTGGYEVGTLRAAPKGRKLHARWATAVDGAVSTVKATAESANEALLRIKRRSDDL